MTTKTIAYLRVSTDKQADGGTSLESQREAITMYAKLYDLDIVAWHSDDGASAKSLDRPELAKVLAAVDAGEADAVIVAKLDRLTRNVYHLGKLLETTFKRAALLSVGEQVDTRSATGRMLLNVITSIAQWERERIGERVADMHAAKRARGERTGRLPYGHADREHGAAEQAVVRRVDELRTAGLAYSAIAELLTAEGVAAPGKGGCWHAKSIARIARRAAA